MDVVEVKPDLPEPAREPANLALGRTDGLKEERDRRVTVSLNLTSAEIGL